MGKFSDALAKGRTSAKEEKQKKRHQGDADTARRLAGVAAALKWTDQVVYSTVQRANADLEKDGLVVNYDGGPTDVGAEVTLTVSKIGMPRLTLFGRSKQPKSIAFKVCTEELVWMSIDGAEAQKLGKLSAVKSDKIEALLVTMLTEIGRDLGSLQAAPAARPEMAGMIALAALRSLAARQVFDRLGYR
jgi:hypothetical protein